MDFTKDNIFPEKPVVLIDLRFPRNVERRVRRPFSTESPKFIDSLLAARLPRLTSLQRLKPIENTRFVFVPNLFPLLSRLGGARFEKSLHRNFIQTRSPRSAPAGDRAKVSSVPGSADVPSALVQAAPAHIRKPPSFVKPFQGLFSRALHTKLKGNQADVPPVSKGIDASAGSAIPFAGPSDVSRLLTVKHSTFVKHPQIVPTGSSQTERVKTQFSVPSFYSPEVDSEKNTHNFVFAKRVSPSNIQAAKLLSPTKPSSETDTANRQTDSSDGISSDIFHKYSAFPAVRIHTDFIADSISRALDADALTIGKDIFFASGKFDLSTPEGIALLGHELTHAQQQLEMGGPLSRPEINESQYRSLESQALENEEKIYKFYSSPAMLSALPRKNEMLQVYQNSVVESPSFVHGISTLASGPPLHSSPVPQLKSTSGTSGAIPPPVLDEGISGEETSRTLKTPSKEANIEEIAEKVYGILKRKLMIERERRGKWPTV